MFNLLSTLVFTLGLETIDRLFLSFLLPHGVNVLVAESEAIMTE